ncbi:MAG: DUF3788 family protein [Eubacteriales bacterium]|nr:DUF3788 family protein [Eubacteriales bacterium]
MFERISAEESAPSYEEMTAHCGAAAAFFTAFNSALSDTWDTEQILRNPYGKKYGWGVGHRRKGKHLCDVFPEVGAFTLMIRLSNAQMDTVLSGLSARAQREWEGKYPCGDGGWLHFRVCTQADLEDALVLMQAKMAARPRR